MKKDNRKGFWSGYKKAGPTLKFTINFAVFALILATVYFLWQNHYGASRRLQEEAQIDRDVKHKELKELLISTDSTKHDELLQTYPQGYILFGIDRENIIIPYASRLKSDYNVNWDSARVLGITADEVSVQLPDIYKEGKEVMINCSAGIARYVGYKGRGRNFTIVDLGIAMGILSDNEKGIIIVAGFQ
jgi:hypothetical protein